MSEIQSRGGVGWLVLDIVAEEILSAFQVQVQPQRTDRSWRNPVRHHGIRFNRGPFYDGGVSAAGD